MYPIAVVSENGHFRAKALLGSGEFSVESPTREAAIAGVKARIEEMTSRGELVWFSGPVFDPVSLPGASDVGYAEQLREIVAEIYRDRDAQKVAEFPE